MATSTETHAHDSGERAAGSSPLRFVTAASLFDGHDAAINVMRRLIQDNGVEVVHLGHNRGVADIVRAAIQEDVDGIAISSYQGGHVEYFKYAVDMFRERGADHIRVFGGGGGTITPAEIADLQAYGVERIYHPHDGMELGLTGMIEDLVQRTTAVARAAEAPDLRPRAPGEGPADDLQIARMLSALEDEAIGADALQALRMQWAAVATHAPVVGIAGTGGAGKSTVTDELLSRFMQRFAELRIAVLAVDPTRTRTGGALLGDRIRMNSLRNERIFMRSMATRRRNSSTSAMLADSLSFLRSSGFDLVIVETVGIGQSDSEIVDLVDIPMYVMTSEFGAASQLEKIDMLDLAEIVVINKFDKRGALDALRDVRKQWRRNHVAFESSDDDVPVYPTIASQFNDPGLSWMFVNLCRELGDVPGAVADRWDPHLELESHEPLGNVLIPGSRVRSLAEIAEQGRGINSELERLAQIASTAQHCYEALKALGDPELPAELQAYAGVAGADMPVSTGEATLATLRVRYDEALEALGTQNLKQLRAWDALIAGITEESLSYTVRGKEITGENYRTSLSGSKIPKIAPPRFDSWGDRLRFLGRENLPGNYPYTGGVFPYRREGEDPTRMFAGEGTPERTNRRFHYLSQGQPAARLSTAFDSVTLYGEDPARRPDIYGKVGNSGVSIATVDDAKKLYSGFDLCAPSTSVSMTINGPAPIILAFFMNAAIDQQIEKHLKETGGWEAAQRKLEAFFAEHGGRPQYAGELPHGNEGLGLGLLGASGDMVVKREVYERIKAETLSTVRGTVQADILKEDQAQNTCIFSTEFALKMMGDVQEYFVEHAVRNFYSVSISGYHIAEAGANPISQLAFTLANGFTIVEYYLARGMAIDDFAPNLSFFFSNGMDPEYAVIGRVARRIWARAMRERYGASPRSQMLKYHVQTSGRSLHAQEISFNDIRTTLQALYAIFDNCNSLHTNAYDEAITTPTEESVRRAVAIQLIINRELGLNMTENPWQGSFIINELTDLVEEAVYEEFERISERGGVLGAMDTMYQRGKIQDESMYYERLKHSGELPLIGVNTFLPTDGHGEQIDEIELMRSTGDEKGAQIENVRAFQERAADRRPAALARLQEVARARGNVFEALMDAVKVASLGQISGALYDVGGEYRRNM
jgi:methylmalonyl-CoA mutase